ncbi:uncharacterized protein Tco025E_00810 [Trypanosoma conorhini]|uniref:Uncharacterized protein n=1 Tax=Trypanosoma conorhini TaxID=83891 RepID=A0A3R7NTU9_9TRYP|nr:uncharacterized protein Tco025E_00810 [Trypanosoma conorhini]RNF26944.1 hypothetical protein Tco025E_00810 [Trypanosoma conorhini]
MPRLLTFKNGVQSCGDGFIKSPASGMWQCTLPPDPLPREGAEPAASAAVARAVAWEGPQPRKKEEAILLRPCPSLLPPQFQLISVGSRYLCSCLVTARPHPLSEVHILRLDKIAPGTRLPAAVAVAFASATEATWADLMLFTRQAAGGGAAAAAVEASHTAVWRLNWVAPAESGIRVGAAYLWRVTEALPLYSRVQDAAAAAEEEAPMHIAVATAREGAGCTPPDRAVRRSEEPPPLPPKQKNKETSPEGLPRRDLSAAFLEALQEEEVATARRVEDTTASASAENASAPDAKNDQQPTYAEVLVRGMRQRHSEAATSAGELVREWRRRLAALRKELRRDLCVDAIPRIARDKMTQLQRQGQQPCLSGCAKAMAALLKAGLQELLCDGLFDAAASLLVGGEGSHRARQLLQECAATARAAGEELEERKGDMAAAAAAVVLRLSHSVLQLRLLRHRCCAAVLLGQPVAAAALHEALRGQKRAMALLQGEWAGAVRPGTTTTAGADDGEDGDSAEEQLVAGVLTAALSLMEMSLLVKKSVALCDYMTGAAGALLLWLRDASGGLVEVPVALLARLEERGAATTRGRLHDTQRRCEALPAVRGGKARGKAEFCCGLVRSVPCCAVFDHQFARTRALVRRLEAAAAAGRAADCGTCSE